MITNDELGEYYEGDGADSAGGRNNRHFGTSTLVVNGVKQPRSDGNNNGSCIFLCDLDSVCQSQHDRAPQLVVKKRDGGHRDIGRAAGSDGDGAEQKERTTYGIVGTKVPWSNIDCLRYLPFLFSSFLATTLPSTHFSSLIRSYKSNFSVRRTALFVYLRLRSKPSRTSGTNLPTYTTWARVITLPAFRYITL